MEENKRNLDERLRERGDRKQERRECWGGKNP
jgi:hypothetical protein